MEGSWGPTGSRRDRACARGYVWRSRLVSFYSAVAGRKHCGACQRNGTAATRGSFPPLQLKHAGFFLFIHRRVNIVLGWFRLVLCAFFVFIGFLVLALLVSSVLLFVFLVALLSLLLLFLLLLLVFPLDSLDLLV
jgi:hypothetical protein